MRIQDANITELIQVVNQLLASSTPGDWRVDGHQIVNAAGETVARVGARRTEQVVNAKLIVEFRRLVPIFLLEIQRLRRLLSGGEGGATPPADHAEAMDRVIGMVERAEQEAACMRVLVGLCPSCVELVAPPFEPCRHQLADFLASFTIEDRLCDGHVFHALFGELDYPPKSIALPDPHRCELREQGMAAGGDNFRCTCCAQCTADCEHAV